MKLLLIFSLLCTNLQPGIDSAKAEPKKKQATSKPQPKKQKQSLPFLPFIIVN
jgi:hypothetical protein